LAHVREDPGPFAPATTWSGRLGLDDGRWFDVDPAPTGFWSHPWVGEWLRAAPGDDSPLGYAHLPHAVLGTWWPTWQATTREEGVSAPTLYYSGVQRRWVVRRRPTPSGAQVRIGVGASWDWSWSRRGAWSAKQVSDLGGIASWTFDDAGPCPEARPDPLANPLPPVSRPPTAAGVLEALRGPPTCWSTTLVSESDLPIAVRFADGRFWLEPSQEPSLSPWAWLPLPYGDSPWLRGAEVVDEHPAGDVVTFGLVGGDGVRLEVSAQWRGEAPEVVNLAWSSEATRGSTELRLDEGGALTAAAESVARLRPDGRWSRTDLRRSFAPPAGCRPTVLSQASKFPLSVWRP
jgi:hypothetical protein